MIDRLRKAVGRFEPLPWIGCLDPRKRASGTFRQILVGNYRVIYRLNKDFVEILAVVHAACASLGMRIPTIEACGPS